jgi:hypothetical protein
MNVISLNFHPTSLSLSSSSSGSDGELNARANETTLIGLIFELKEDEASETYKVLGYPVSTFSLVCGTWILVGHLLGLHWRLQTLNVLKFFFSLGLTHFLHTKRINPNGRVCRFYFFDGTDSDSIGPYYAVLSVLQSDVVVHVDRWPSISFHLQFLSPSYAGISDWFG